MRHEFVQSSQQLLGLCERFAAARTVCFDTEFVSEDTYRPDLCLIQVAVDEHLAVIDPRLVDDVTPFWAALANGDHETVVHAGREEFRFCTKAVGRRPQRLFDVQIAAGLVGMEYPASYGKLLSKLCGTTLPKGETRTDWRRRPLSDRQIEYALQDVVYLRPLRDELARRLEDRNRTAWMQDEMDAWQRDVEQAETRDRWRRVSGIAGLSARSLVIARELWRWRESEAERQNRPPKRVLRDDLLVELARRGRTDLKQVRAIRGIERSSAKRYLPEISACIQRAVDLPRDQWPQLLRSEPFPQTALLGQFIATALNSICRSQQIAPSLVGTVQDVRDLIVDRLYSNDGSERPLSALSQGWRAEVVGRKIDDLLAGKIALRIADPRSDMPLIWEQL